MGSVYGVWGHMNREQKNAKHRYIQMLYSLLFRSLVSKNISQFLDKLQLWLLINLFLLCT